MPSQTHVHNHCLVPKQLSTATPNGLRVISHCFQLYVKSLEIMPLPTLSNHPGHWDTQKAGNRAQCRLLAEGVIQFYRGFPVCVLKPWGKMAIRDPFMTLSPYKLRTNVVILQNVSLKSAVKYIQIGFRSTAFHCLGVPVVWLGFLCCPLFYLCLRELGGRRGLTPWCWVLRQAQFISNIFHQFRKLASFQGRFKSQSTMVGARICFPRSSTFVKAQTSLGFFVPLYHCESGVMKCLEARDPKRSFIEYFCASCISYVPQGSCLGRCKLLKAIVQKGNVESLIEGSSVAIKLLQVSTSI